MSSTTYLLLLQSAKKAELPSWEQLEDPQVFVFDLPNKVKVLDAPVPKLAVAQPKLAPSVIESPSPKVSIDSPGLNTLLIESKSTKVVII